MIATGMPVDVVGLRSRLVRCVEEGWVFTLGTLRLFVLTVHRMDRDGA